MDFIEQLPRSEDIYDAILVIVDHLMKMGIFIPTHTGITAEELARIFLSNVFAKHGLPADIIADHRSEFTSEFWRSLSMVLGIKLNHSTAYHPETDGQTEWVNQSLEQYLCMYCNYQQDNWLTLLPMAEFTHNNATHSATQVSPFLANKGYHPTLQVSMDPWPANPSFDMANSLSTLHSYLQEQIKITQDQTKAKVNHHHTPHLSTK
jgi:transposase InsO family protein